MKYVKKLQAIIEGESDLRSYIAQDLIEKAKEGEMESYVDNLMQYGCQSGMVSGLIYYRDTKEFYCEHIDEIDELRQEMEESLGEPLKIGYPSYNWLAWFAYEETARNIALELGLEV